MVEADGDRDLLACVEDYTYIDWAPHEHRTEYQACVLRHHPLLIVGLLLLPAD